MFLSFAAFLRCFAQLKLSSENVLTAERLVFVDRWSTSVLKSDESFLLSKVGLFQSVADREVYEYRHILVDCPMSVFPEIQNFGEFQTRVKLYTAPLNLKDKTGCSLCRYTLFGVEFVLESSYRLKSVLESEDVGLFRELAEESGCLQYRKTTDYFRLPDAEKEGTVTFQEVVIEHEYFSSRGWAGLRYGIAVNLLKFRNKRLVSQASRITFAKHSQSKAFDESFVLKKEFRVDVLDNVLELHFDFARFVMKPSVVGATKVASPKKPLAASSFKVYKCSFLKHFFVAVVPSVVTVETLPEQKRVLLYYFNDHDKKIKSVLFKNINRTANAEIKGFVSQNFSSFEVETEVVLTLCKHSEESWVLDFSITSVRWSVKFSDKFLEDKNFEVVEKLPVEEDSMKKHTLLDINAVDHK